MTYCVGREYNDIRTNLDIAHRFCETLGSESENKKINIFSFL